MFVCMECDKIEDMSMFEEPQCEKCGSTMYPINPNKENKSLQLAMTCVYCGCDPCDCEDQK